MLKTTNISYFNSFQLVGKKSSAWIRHKVIRSFWIKPMWTLPEYSDIDLTLYFCFYDVTVAQTILVIPYWQFKILSHRIVCDTKRRIAKMHSKIVASNIFGFLFVQNHIVHNEKFFRQIVNYI